MNFRQFNFAQLSEKVEGFFFALLFFLLPFQVGRHFWPSFSFVSGLRVDYLSPTLYLLDLVIFFLFILSLFKKIKFFNPTHKTLFLALILFFVVIFSGLIFAQEKLAVIFGLAKILEFIFLAWYLATFFKTEYINLLTNTFALSSFFSAAIAIWQFIIQKSIGGLFYFLGERSFYLGTPGIAAMNINGQLILRPYGFFPHPNLLAFYLFFANVLILTRFTMEEKKIIKLFYIFVLLINSLAILLTFSRIMIIIYLLFLVFFLIKNKFINLNKGFIFIAVLFVISGYFYKFYYRFFDLKFIFRDFLLRRELLYITEKIIFKNFFFGTGLNNFFYQEISYQKQVSPILLQPVHNIFLFVFSEIGVLGFSGFLLLIYFSFKSILKNAKESDRLEIKNFYKAILIIFIAILAVGFFDHFPVTLEQGEIMLSILIGLSNSRLSKKPRRILN